MNWPNGPGPQPQYPDSKWDDGPASEQGNNGNDDDQDYQVDRSNPGPHDRR